MTSTRTMLAGLLLLSGAAPAGGQEQNPSFNLVNAGLSPIRELYVTPAGDARWGRNRLEGVTIAVGGSYPVRRRIDGNCIFDIRAVFADGRTEDRRTINTCTAADISVGRAAASQPAVGRSAGPAAPTLSAPGKAADDPSFRLVNRGAQPVVEAFATPAGLGNWGENRLRGTPLAPATDRMVHVPRQGTCLFDLRVVFADHTAREKRRADLCRITNLPVP